MNKLDQIEEALRKLCYVEMSYEQAEQCVESMHTAITELRQERERIRTALVKLRDCDWTISLPDRMDAVRDIARAALGESNG